MMLNFSTWAIFNAKNFEQFVESIENLETMAQ
jgi:hypothetical protein